MSNLLTQTRQFERFSPKTSKVVTPVPVVSMERRLLQMPYEILLEVFRRLPRGEVIELSKLCSKFKDISEDTRIWKDVYIKYEGKNKVFAFEELYSGPAPVKVVDLSGIKIDSPVSSQTDQIVKVTKLNLSSITVTDVTMEAILAKYQSIELYLNNGKVHFPSSISSISDRGRGISPEAFSKQTALEVLSLRGLEYRHFDEEVGKMIISQCHHLWVAQVLRNCKNLKSLDLGYTTLTNSDMLGLVEHLPTRLEKLLLANICLENSFFELLAKSIPNLRELELGLNCVKSIFTSPSSLGFQLLESLRVISYANQDIIGLCMYITKLPALKRVCVIYNQFVDVVSREIELKIFRMALEPHGIIVTVIKKPELSQTVDGILWKMS